LLVEETPRVKPKKPATGLISSTLSAVWVETLLMLLWSDWHFVPLNQGNLWDVVAAVVVGVVGAGGRAELCSALAVSSLAWQISLQCNLFPPHAMWKNVALLPFWRWTRTWYLKSQ
jgi:hypothetical protein